MGDYINNSNLKRDDNYDNLSDEEKTYLKNYIKSRKDELTNTIQLKQFNCDLENYTPPPLSPDLGRKYDQVVKGDIRISRINKNNYKINFDKIGKFLLYQIWDEKDVATYTYMPKFPNNDTHPRSYSDATKYAKDNPGKIKNIDITLNNYRYVIIKNPKKWVEYFNTLNNRRSFKPTTVMEISSKKYIFVIYKVKINKKGKLVFYVTTKEINIINDSKSDKVKIFKKLPIGKHKNVRFDIDCSQDTSCGGNNTCECWCPNDFYVIGSGTYFSCQQNRCNTNYNSIGDICYYCPPGEIEKDFVLYNREMWGYWCCFVNSGLPVLCVTNPNTEGKESYEWINTGSDGGVQCCPSGDQVYCSPASLYSNGSDPTCNTTSIQTYCTP